MKGNKFTERKQHPGGNQVLFSVLRRSHQNQTTVAPVAAPSPTTVVPGLVLLEEKHHDIILAPLLMNSHSRGGLKLLYLEPTGARFRLAGIFMADPKLLLAAVPSRDKQPTGALISGLKLTDPLLLDLWNESGQTSSHMYPKP